MHDNSMKLMLKLLTYNMIYIYIYIYIYGSMLDIVIKIKLCYS